MFWFQKESGAEPCPVGYALSLTESFQELKFTKRQGDPHHDKEAIVVGQLDAGSRDGIIGRLSHTTLRPALPQSKHAALTA
jgi:hypothetical protein